jgi:hypothetical protein
MQGAARPRISFRLARWEVTKLNERAQVLTLGYST